MSAWSNKTVKVGPIQFDGDAVEFEVKRLRVEDMLKLSRFYDAASGKLTFSSPLEVVSEAQGILPKYVVGIAGLKDADGSDVPLSDFLEASSEFYFVPLVGSLFGALIQVSTLGEQVKK